MNVHTATSTRVHLEQLPGGGPQADLAWLRQQVIAAISHIAAPVVGISVRVVNDPEMSAIHQQYCNDARVTDVLTFPSSAPGGPIEVDIVVCADEAARRAAELGHSLERELLLYIIHGLLHCAGFDDHAPAAHRAMHEEEDRILRAIGVGATFASPSHQPTRQSQERSESK